MKNIQHTPVRILAHLVAGYPDEETSFRIAQALASTNIWALELQFPFSDPSADGPLIQTACAQVLQQKFTLKKGFSLADRIIRTTNIPLFIMSYANLAVCYGIDKFIQHAQSIGVHGLIIPDLVPDTDEGVIASCQQHNMYFVPVTFAGMSVKRQSLYTDFPYIYVSLRTGITGTRITQITKHLIHFLTQIKKKNTHIIGGFGITNAKQVKQIAPFVDSIAIGSALLHTLQSSNFNLSTLTAFIQNLYS